MKSVVFMFLLLRSLDHLPMTTSFVKAKLHDESWNIITNAVLQVKMIEMANERIQTLPMYIRPHAPIAVFELDKPVNMVTLVAHARMTRCPRNIYLDPNEVHRCPIIEPEVSSTDSRYYSQPVPLPADSGRVHDGLHL